MRLVSFFLIIYVFLLTILTGCSDDNGDNGSTGPTSEEPEKIEFKKVFDMTNLPDDLNSIGISKAVWLDERDYAALSYTDIVKINNNDAESVLSGVTDIAGTSDGYVYGVGRVPNAISWEAIFYSTDGGNTFDHISKPLMDAGVSLYKGYPDEIMVRKLNDGSYLMILMVGYTSTNVGYTLYEDYYLESQNGIDWEYRDQNNTSQHFQPSAIDNEGNVFYLKREKNQYFGIDHILYRSDDKGVTVNRVENIQTTAG